MHVIKAEHCIIVMMKFSVTRHLFKESPESALLSSCNFSSHLQDRGDQKDERLVFNKYKIIIAFVVVLNIKLLWCKRNKNTNKGCAVIGK